MGKWFSDPRTIGNHLWGLQGLENCIQKLAKTQEPSVQPVGTGSLCPVTCSHWEPSLRPVETESLYPVTQTHLETISNVKRDQESHSDLGNLSEACSDLYLSPVIHPPTPRNHLWVHGGTGVCDQTPKTISKVQWSPPPDGPQAQ